MAFKRTHVHRKSCVPLYILCVELSHAGADDYSMCTKIYKAPTPPRSRKVLYQSSPYHTCAFY